jgi:NAD-dependent deacetylase
MNALRLEAPMRLLVLTGAGISAESGLATFRGGGGLWAGHRVEAVATPEAFRANPELVWRFYSMRRRDAAEARPNPAHAALAAVERRLGARFLLATQNVDGLHATAGSERVVELHGSAWRTRCSRCMAPPFEDHTYPVEPPLPRCSRCGALLRPDIVWFGEMLAAADRLRVERFILDAGAGGDPWIFLAIGTSGAVWPAAGYVELAALGGAETWLVNLDPADNAGAFDHVVTGRAGDVLPALLGLEGDAAAEPR